MVKLNFNPREVKPLNRDQMTAQQYALSLWMDLTEPRYDSFECACLWAGADGVAYDQLSAWAVQQHDLPDWMMIELFHVFKHPRPKATAFAKDGELVTRALRNHFLRQIAERLQRNYGLHRTRSKGNRDRESCASVLATLPSVFIEEESIDKILKGSKR